MENLESLELKSTALVSKQYKIRSKKELHYAIMIKRELIFSDT